jgi:ribosome-associated protein
MHEKKAEQILLLDLSEIKGANFDYFVITHGNSTTQVDAIAEEVRRKVKMVCRQNPAHAEGFTNAEWILLDYLDVVVHIFQKEVREHYQLENLWADAIITPIVEEIPVKTTAPVPKTTPAKKEPPAKKPVKKDITKKTAPKEPAKKNIKKTTTKTTKTHERKTTPAKPKSKTTAKSAKSKV